MKEELNFQEGIRYAQWGIMRFYGDPTCPVPEWLETKRDNGLSFRLEKLREGQYMSPVYGPMDKE